jgi:hypothetical protein
MAATLHHLRTDPPPNSLVGYLLQWAHLRPILAMTTTWFLTECTITLTEKAYGLNNANPNTRMAAALGVSPQPASPSHALLAACWMRVAAR